MACALRTLADSLAARVCPAKLNRGRAATGAARTGKHGATPGEHRPAPTSAADYRRRVAAARWQYELASDA